MIRSMTGFGRGTFESSERSFVIEIKSVNHRYLDLSVKMPRNFVSLEDRIRKLLGEKINRGKVDVFINQYTYAKSDSLASFNSLLADSYVKCLEEIKGRYDVRDDISVSLIARFPDIITMEQKQDDLDEIWNNLKKPINDAINMLVAMRETEGQKLKEDILRRCSYIKEMVDKVALRAPSIVKEYREKLLQRLKDMNLEVHVDDNRVAMEIAIFSDKANIDEEIVRLNSHLVQMKETLDMEEPVGRKLDFLVQEINRETNTIASKANDIELVNIVLNIKNEIEKIREQIQNIE